MKQAISLLTASVLLVACAAFAAGCRNKAAAAGDKLVVISPHNNDIKKEFEAAFGKFYKDKTGRQVDIEWRDVGGGSNQILTYIVNAYSGGSSPGVDIIWGGGDQNFQRLADLKLLAPLKLPKDVTDNVPQELGGVQLYDATGNWVGTCLSAFGFLYNKELLSRRGIAPPQTWDDLGGPQFYDMITLADPTLSGSAAVAYEMVVQSGKDWPDGWARLMAIMGNTKKFYPSASEAAKAPETGEAAIAACIDFYGETRVAALPDKLVFVRPKNQTAFTPDPIAILRDPPHPELAQGFVDFVMSDQGQCLWALKPGSPGGPANKELGRQPIRKDFYWLHKGQMLNWIVNPYELSAGMKLDSQMKQSRGDVLNLLVRTAAIDNRDGIKKARKKIIDSNFDKSLVDEFNRLPDNVNTREKVLQVVAQLADKAQADTIATDWTKFFRDKYEAIAK
ncbi:MAG: ABC transporter substrate-binding protein [Phycisphaerae bacterium]